MNAEDQNQDFEKLQHLLKLKRYEQPPPRYFKDFSGQVVARIRGGTPGGRFESFDDIVHQTPWLRRVWHALEGRPAVSGMLAAIVCGLMIAAVFISENTPPRLNVLAVDDGAEPANELPGSFALGGNLAGAPQLFSSTNLGTVPPGTSLFDRMPRLQGGGPFPVNYTPLLQK